MIEYEYYDWNSLIDEKHRDRMRNDIEMGIRAGKFWHNSPKYQTNWNVFQDFTDLKMAFIWSAFRYLGKEVQIKNVQSWAFQTSLKHAEDRDTLWHHHNHNPATKTVSGVFYLHLPEDVKDLEKAGTELAPNSPEGEGNFFVPWKTGHWMIYPGAVWHRPGVVQSLNDRYIVAADMEF
tara:strand:- start:3705 stop:4238 length:534 start_codon:yes stop_codon:yes gene_type:complete